MRPHSVRKFRPAGALLFSVTPAFTGISTPMNRLDLQFPSSDQPSPADSFELPLYCSTSDAGNGTQTVTAELVTRRVKPGTSIRRIRNHRCSWPRRF